ncbi:MAG: VacB/RNase II family 3'-5' exoribonuclease [Elusimicrobiota bacterium]
MAQPEKLHEGKVQHHGNFAFLLAEKPGQEDLMLRGPSLRLAMDGDRVQARVTPGDKGRPAGEIVKVLQRARLSITGVLRQRAERWIAIPEEADERDAIRVLGFLNDIKPRDGEVVVVTITQWPTLKEAAGGQVSEALGMPGEAGVRMRAVLRTRDLPEAFPKEVLEESRAFPDAVPPEMWEGRLDLRNAAVFTIDGADAKDFDDAVSLEVVNPHIMRLGVHIADVSHYVKKGTALDGEAAGRATSIYLADRVVPMLPPNLSDSLCSLMPDVERLTVSCFMDVDAAGKVRDSELKVSVIKSRRRFTYEEVQALINGKSVPNVDPQVGETVLRMWTLCRALTRQRMNRGALDMTNPEYKVRVGPDGRPLDVIKRPRLGSHRLIEEFMLLANETVARTLLKKRVPFLSRIHPDPDARKLEILGNELKKMGCFVPTSLAASPSTAMQIILQKALAHPMEETINMLVMRSLKQASYSHMPGGHFGLASEAYCHFTSPIRRYPDLVTHRAIKAVLEERPGEPLGAGLKELGLHCSQRERVAADAERRSVDILRAELLKKRVGEVFEGVVSGTAGFGLFVTLKDFGSSGLVRGVSAPLGSKVKVQLDGVNEGKGELDLSIPGAKAAPAAPRYDPSKPKFDPNPKSRFNPNKPRYKGKAEAWAKPKFEPGKKRFDPSKPKYDPSKPKFDPTKARFDPSKKRYDPSKPKFDPNQTRYETKGKPAADWKPKPKSDAPKPKFDRGAKPKSDPNAKPKFYDRFTSKKRRRD